MVGLALVPDQDRPIVVVSLVDNSQLAPAVDHLMENKRSKTT
jgi:hypothetical protein